MKTYMKPNINIVNIEIQQILAGSPLVQDGGGNLTGGEMQDEGATGPGLSRGGRGFWDDEEDF